MPRIKDNEILEGKKNRNQSIRDYFNKRWAEGVRYEIIESEVKTKWGVGSSTIDRILKEKI
jgi:hypothetical protein